LIRYDPKYFQKFSFSREAIKRYFQNASQDLKIAQTDPYSQVRFSYAYQALLKAGIALIARQGGVKVRSVPGHHVKVIDGLARLLEDEEIKIIGHAMRKKRNMDMYEGGEYISKKEADDYLKFVEAVVKRVKGIIGTAARRGP
jgi:HEPN domain-containing protein